jgi:dolichol-phosphate mannosyltransferase
MQSATPTPPPSGNSGVDSGGYPRLGPEALQLALHGAAGAEPELSLVAPVFNEVDNLSPLLERVRAAFGERLRWELVAVDDGSTDGSTRVLEELARAERRLRVVVFGRNCGQSAAVAAGIRVARAPLIATLDADLQNDPGDLPAMLAALGTADAVVGYRQRRRDTFVRRASSKIANGLRNRISGDQIRDTGCSLKVFRAAAIRSLPYFDGMHRFLPTLLRYHGYTVLEHPVSHHPRVAGQSKYGIRNRALRALLDLLAVRWMRSRRIELPIERIVGSGG